MCGERQETPNERMLMEMEEWRKWERSRKEDGWCV